MSNMQSVVSLAFRPVTITKAYGSEKKGQDQLSIALTLQVVLSYYNNISSLAEEFVHKMENAENSKPTFKLCMQVE